MSFVYEDLLSCYIRSSSAKVKTGFFFLLGHDADELEI